MNELKTCACKQKSSPRSLEQVKSIENRINRISGQLNGVKKMIAENAYCNDILMQICAISKALKALSGEILKEHLHTCVTESVLKGDELVLDEVVELFKKY